MAEEDSFMDDVPTDRDVTADSKPGAGVGRGPVTGPPRWVKVFGIIAIALVLLFVIIHLAGGGMGSHTP
ncbi:hypothetical protein [Pseudarthrobacter sp. NIBRBAC000502770]|uniref:hypothetical protein n=1 Tax=Pseudarthrobacter sp. NIBRBAC000502770 TaxID=2590785 RepID=UPI0011408ABE|nr:hypothetical protein [Pseudarthrobacter sp. NIBRBAC000502770]QDG87101.1 hypothetical protein NIBR502770_00310 [Pseudarthrobacter sp. NIBRBAC000502770]